MWWAPTRAHHIAGYRSQLDIGRFQHLVDTIDLLGTLLHERFAIAGEISENADWLRWNKAGMQQPMAQQVSKPFAVLDVGFVSWQALMCCALTSSSVRPSSRTLKTGRQRTPVLSIAT